MSEIHGLAAYLDRLIENEAWADTGAEAAAHIRDELGWRPPARVIRTAEELESVASETVVMSAAGTIACRHPSGFGVVLGNEHPFEWSVLQLPVTVVREPEEEA